MSMRNALRIILGIGLFGLAFSGYLSYRELFAAPVAQSCPAIGEPGTILGYPPCIYGLLMYFAIVVVAAAGLQSSRHHQKRSTPWTSAMRPDPKET